jgi:tetratricopeptide (TPR) repeat protein
MAASVSPHDVDRLPSIAGLRRQAARLVAAVMEAGVLVLVCLSPWAFGAVDPDYEVFIFAGVAGLVGLWGVRILLEGRLTWVRCPVTLCLAALVLTAAFQLVPLPRGVLGWLSPATARLYEQLLPAEPEVLPFDTMPAAAPPAGRTLSLDPGQTRQDLMRLLGVFVLFALIRNHVASPASLWRLSIVALVNGTALALFGLVHFFTAPANTLYWKFPSPGQCFGPFACRNHFAFYTNLCVGLGVGLLLGARSFRAGPRARKSSAATRPGLLQDAPALWVGAALVFMVSGMVFALSRGGIVALLTGAIACLSIQLWRTARLSRLGAGLLVLLMAVALLHWFGWERVENRLATLWQGKALQESRLPLWLRVLPAARDFPVWGTGLGTFPVVEPLYRRAAAEETLAYSNAENDYLEALIEGGVIRLVLSALAVALVLRFGYRAFCRHEGGWRGGLAMGALLAFICLAVESFGDFGLHIPAIAVLATVLCAQLCALGDPAKHGPPTYSVRWGGLAPLAAPALAAVLGLALWNHGWTAYRVQELRERAIRLEQRADPATPGRQLELLEEAARLVPASAPLQAEVAQAYMDVYRDRRRELLDARQLADGSRAVGELILAGFSPAPGGAAVAPCWYLDSLAGQELGPRDDERLTGQYLRPALGHFLRARALCPLLPEPHRFLADYAGKLPLGDGRLTYLERAARVVPSDPVFWYLVGAEYLDRQPARAWESWRRCLELSDRFLEPILRKSAARLGPDGLLRRLLPDRPAVLLAAAEVYPAPAAQRHPFLEKALQLLDRQAPPWKAEDLHLQAQIQGALGASEKAVATFRAALAVAPKQVAWRLELAHLLHETGHPHEAGRELRILLAYQPDHVEAQGLLQAVLREIADNR